MVGMVRFGVSRALKSQVIIGLSMLATGHATILVESGCPRVIQADLRPRKRR